MTAAEQAEFELIRTKYGQDRHDVATGKTSPVDTLTKDLESGKVTVEDLIRTAYDMNLVPSARDKVIDQIRRIHGYKDTPNATELFEEEPLVEELTQQLVEEVHKVPRGQTPVPELPKQELPRGQTPLPEVSEKVEELLPSGQTPVPVQEEKPSTPLPKGQTPLPEALRDETPLPKGQTPIPKQEEEKPSFEIETMTKPDTFVENDLMPQAPIVSAEEVVEPEPIEAVPVGDVARGLVRVIDGDTVDVAGTRNRIQYIDTEESVHPDKRRNTQRGQETSDFMKAVVPSDSDIKVEAKGKDRHGRDLSQATRIINGVEVDWGLVVMDQNMSHYETQYGVAPDNWHEVYKQYYSKYAPYQYDEIIEPMPPEKRLEMSEKHLDLTAAYQAYDEEVPETRERLDAAIANLYGNPKDVAQYRHFVNQERKKAKVKDGGLYAAYELAERDPKFREVYNTAVRQGTLPRNSVGLANTPQGFWERLGATFEQMSVMTNLSDRHELVSARRLSEQHKDIQIPVEDIKALVPEQYQSAVEQEYNKNGALAAQKYTELLAEDIANNRVFDNLPFHKQLGYGALAIIADPSSWVTGGVMGKGVTSSLNTLHKAFNLSTKPKIATGTSIAAWGAGAGIEGAVYDLPRFAEGDLTYTGDDYLATVVMSAGFGTALAGVLIGGGKWMDSKELKKSQVNYTAALNEELAKAQGGQTQPLTGKQKVLQALNELGQQVTAKESAAFQSKTVTDSQKLEIESIKQDMTNLAKAADEGNLGQVINNLLSPEAKAILNRPDPIITNVPSPIKPQPVTVADLFEVQEIDTQMFNNVLNLARKQMDNNGDLFQFLKRQAGLNKFAKDSNQPLLQQEARKLNATLVKLVSAFPDGKLPYEQKAILAELRMGQQRWVTNNAIADILDSPNAEAQLPQLQRYVKKLREMDLWLDNIQPEPMSWLELSQYAPSLFDIVNTVDGRTIEINRSLPADHKFLHDIVELNNQARKSGDINFVNLVDEINGMVANRLMQREMGTLVSSTIKTADKTKWFPKKVKRSPDDVMKALKETGIEQFTPEYIKIREEQRARMEKIIAEQNPSPKQLETIRRVSAGRLEKRVKDEGVTKLNPEWVEAKQKLKDGYEYLPDEIREVGKQDIIKMDGGKVIEDARSGRGDDIMESDTSKTGSEFDDRVDVAGNYGDYGFDAGQKSEFDFIDPVGKEADLLPRKFNEPVKLYAYDTKDTGQVKYLNEQLNKRVLNKLQDKVDASNKLRANEAEVMQRVISNVTKDFNKTVKAAQESGKMDYMFAIIRGSESLARKQQAEAAAAKTKAVEGKSDTVVKPEDSFKGKVLSEDDVSAAVNDLETRTPDEKAGIFKQMKLSYEEMLQMKVAEIQGKLREFELSEKAVFDEAIKTTGALDWIGRKLSFLTKDIATKLQASDNIAMSFIGFKVTELGRGFGGNAQRAATGGLIKHKVLTELQMDFMPAYVKAMKDYAASKGSNMLETMNAQQMTGAHNPIVKQFNQEFMWLQEMRRLGKPLPANVAQKLQHVVKFADEWDKMMAKAHTHLVDSKIEGFSADRKVSHYVPRIHKYGNYKRMIDQYGVGEVRSLLEKSMLSANKGLTTLDAVKKSEEFIEWIMRQDGTTAVEDLFMPQADTRSMSRMNLDMTMEHKGMRMFDLVSDEVMELGMKYSNRVAGWVGLSDSTNGMLNSNMAIDAYRELAKDVGKDGKVLFDDVVNMMFGRPTRNGLAEEIRHFKDLTALTRMGGLGSAQLVESGNVITKGVINMFSDPVVAKRLFDVAKSDPNDKALLAEIQSISRLSDDMEWLQRQSVNLEQTEHMGLQGWRKHSTKLADMATFGKYKAPASRLLGKVTGFNAVRRYQSRVAQTGFVLNAVGHFTRGKSAISPKRLADLGLTTPDGKNSALQDAISKYVELDADNLPVKMNFDKWPKEVRDQFTYALLRDEAQNVQKSLVGELPAWYNKPLMALAFQFRQFPIVAQQKQLGRALAMADKEAVVATLLNAATAGLVRVSKAALVVGGIAAVSEREFRFNSDPEHMIRDASKYVAQFGVMADATDFVTKAYSSYDDDGFSADLGDTALSFAPIWGLMKDYKDLAAPTSSNRERVDATFGVVPLGNVLFADMLRAQAQEKLAE